MTRTKPTKPAFFLIPMALLASHRIVSFAEPNQRGVISYATPKEKIMKKLIRSFSIVLLLLAYRGSRS